MRGDASLAEALEQRAYSRAAGKPLTVVLVGSGPLVAWEEAHRERGVARLNATSADDTVAAYLAQPRVHALVTESVDRRVAGVRGASRGRDGSDLERRLWAEITGDAFLAAGDADGQLLVEFLMGGAPTRRVLGTVVRVLDQGAPCALLECADLDSAIRSANVLREAAPALPIGVPTTSAAWLAWRALPGREHAKARIDALEEGDQPSLGDARRLALEAQLAPTPATDEAARSAAERALFDALEAHSASRGLFHLNHTLAIPFGSRALEIDLACPSLRIAIEVDGYFHFRDADAYRRDRRKDVVLQREGYFVLRVLAEDVVARLANAVATVHETIALLSKGEPR